MSAGDECEDWLIWTAIKAGQRGVELRRARSITLESSRHLAATPFAVAMRRGTIVLEIGGRSAWTPAVAEAGDALRRERRR